MLNACILKVKIERIAFAKLAKSLNTQRHSRYKDYSKPSKAIYQCQDRAELQGLQRPRRGTRIG